MPNARSLASRTMKHSASVLDRPRRGEAAGFHRFGWRYSSGGARSHQSLISAASMRSPLDPSINSTFSRNPDSDKLQGLASRRSPCSESRPGQEHLSQWPVASVDLGMRQPPVAPASPMRQDRQPLPRRGPTVPTGNPNRSSVGRESVDARGRWAILHTDLVCLLWAVAGAGFIGSRESGAPAPIERASP